jgi:aminoglycoside phosphotransferase family enzyme
MSLKQVELISELKNRYAYPHKVLSITIEETHISWVLLTGLFAYKVKKELKFGDILDFSTLCLRKNFCQAEVDINKLLCGDMYLGVVKIVKSNGGVRIVPLKSRERALEYAVKMKEIPQKFRMDNLLLDGKITLEMIKKLTSKLVRFHHFTPTNNTIQRFGRPEFMMRKVHENFVTLSKLMKVDTKLENKLKTFIKNNDKLFLQRIKEGKIRDIHGDLYLKNVFIVDGRFYLYDRIEFNKALRYADVAEDIAHFAMDLSFHKESNLSSHFISQYEAQSNDTNLANIIYFLMCYKACVRAKVSLFRAKTTTNDARALQVEEAISHLKLAESYLKLF